MQASVGGSARIQGVGNTVGLTANGVALNPAAAKAFWLWLFFVAILFFFHVGGARL
jgi:hypothetical protein